MTTTDLLHAPTLDINGDAALIPFTSDVMLSLGLNPSMGYIQKSSSLLCMTACLNAALAQLSKLVKSTYLVAHIQVLQPCPPHTTLPAQPSEKRSGVGQAAQTLSKAAGLA